MVILKVLRIICRSVYWQNGWLQCQNISKIIYQKTKRRLFKGPLKVKEWRIWQTNFSFHQNLSFFIALYLVRITNLCFTKIWILQKISNLLMSGFQISSLSQTFEKIKSAAYCWNCTLLFCTPCRKNVRTFIKQHVPFLTDLRIFYRFRFLRIWVFMVVVP